MSTKKQPDALRLIEELEDAALAFHKTSNVTRCQRAKRQIKALFDAKDARIAELEAAASQAQPPAQALDARKPLTESEVSSVYFEVLGVARIQDPTLINRLVRAIEAAHGITAAQHGGANANLP